MSNPPAAAAARQAQPRKAPRPAGVCTHTQDYSLLEIKITPTGTVPHDPVLLDLLLCISTSQNSPGQ